MDFTKLSLEELMDVEVTSVSKRRQRVADAAAAVFVIGQEDIRRSGATSVPELLRMIPGVEVARIDANKWAVSIRGFNGRFSSKLLVVIDGRSVYNPLYSGVFWNAQDVVLEDVERIEVIRGPGATVWGANAVNGVINIITKSARDTQGTLLSAGGGTKEYGFGTARFGGKAGDKVAYRGYVKSLAVDDSPIASGDRGADATHQVRTGFRIDGDPTGRDLLTLSADLYKQDYGSTAVSQPLLVPPYSRTFDERAKTSGGNVLGRWSRQVSQTSSITAQAYYDRFEMNEQGLRMTTDVGDVDLQHEFDAFARNHVVWGLGYRYTRNSISTDVRSDYRNEFVAERLHPRRDRAHPRKASPHHRLEGGAQRLHRHRGSAERADPLVADDGPVGVGGGLTRRSAAVGRRAGYRGSRWGHPAQRAGTPRRNRFHRRPRHRRRGPPRLRGRLSRPAAGQRLVRRHRLLQHLR